MKLVVSPHHTPEHTARQGWIGVQIHPLSIPPFGISGFRSFQTGALVCRGGELKEKSPSPATCTEIWSQA